MPNLPPAIARVHCLAISGADARRFAQAQFSSDVDALAAGHWQWSAWLNPAGRVMALMHLFDPGDGSLFAVMRGGNPETIRTELARYLLRSRATLTLEIRTARAGGPSPLGTLHAEDGCVVLGCGPRSLWLDPAPAPADASALTDWRLADIRAGWPNLPAGAARYLAPALGLRRLGAIALQKGCYPGQEIMARLQHRGGRTRGLYRIGGPRAPTPGDHASGAGSRGVSVLDVEAAGGGYEALVTAPQTDAGAIDIEGNAYAILARFTT